MELQSLWKTAFCLQLEVTCWPSSIGKNDQSAHPSNSWVSC